MIWKIFVCVSRIAYHAPSHYLGMKYSLKQAAIDGEIETGSLMAGQSAGLIKDILPVRLIIDRMIADSEAGVTQVRQWLCQYPLSLEIMSDRQIEQAAVFEIIPIIHRNRP